MSTRSKHPNFDIPSEVHKRGAGNKKLPPKSYFSKLLVPILPTTKIDLEKAAYVKPPPTYVKPPPIKPKKTKLPPKSYFFKSNVPKSHDSDLRPVNHKNPIPIARRIPDEDHIPYKPVSRGILDNSQKPFSRNRHDQAKEIQLPSRRYEPDGISRRMSNTDFPKYRHDDKAKEIPTPSKNIRRTKSDIKPTLSRRISDEDLYAPYKTGRSDDDQYVTASQISSSSEEAIIPKAIKAPVTRIKSHPLQLSEPVMRPRDAMSILLQNPSQDHVFNKSVKIYDKKKSKKQLFG